MRLSAIAEELIARDEEVSFVGSISNLPWVEDQIAELGFSEICEFGGEIFIVHRKNLNRKNGGVDRAGFADSHTCNWDAWGHLNGA